MPCPTVFFRGRSLATIARLSRDQARQNYSDRNSAAMSRCIVRKSLPHTVAISQQLSRHPFTSHHDRNRRLHRCMQLPSKRHTKRGCIVGGIVLCWLLLSISIVEQAPDSRSHYLIRVICARARPGSTGRRHLGRSSRRHRHRHASAWRSTNDPIA